MPAKHVPRPRAARSRADYLFVQTVASDLPDSLWLAIAEVLAKTHPYACIQLTMVCRSSRRAVYADEGLWINILRASEGTAWRLAEARGTYPMPRHPLLTFLTVSAPPDFLRRPLVRINRVKPKWLLSCFEDKDLAPDMRTALVAHARRRTVVAHCPRCAFCGARYHHHPVWALGVRACDLCFRERLVSCAALWHDYGVNFHRHVPAITAGVFYFVSHTRDARSLVAYTHNPVDFVHRWNSLVFFWRPHIERLVDLPAAARHWREARAAAPVLTARLRALFTRILIGHQGKPFRDITSHMFYTDTSAQWKAGNHAARIPLAPIRSHSDAMAHSRALLQRLFLTFPWRRLVLSSTRNPSRTLGTLRLYEAARGRMAPYTPTIANMPVGGDGARMHLNVERTMPP